MVSESEKEELEFRRNPPTFADQGEDMSDSDDVFGSGGEGGGNPYGSSLGSSDFGSGGGGFGSFGGFGDGMNNDPFSQSNTMQNPQQQQNGPKSWDDHMFDGGAKAAKASAKGTMAFGKAVANSDYGTYAKTGNTSIKLGIGLTVLTIVLGLMSIFFDLNNVVTLIAGSVMTVVVGLMIFGITYDKAKEAEEIRPVEDPEDEEAADDGMFDLDSLDDDDDDDWSDDSTDEWEDKSDDSEDWFDDDKEDEIVEVEEVDVDEAIETIPEITAGTQTRSFLMEQYKKVLPNVTPDYRQWREYEEGDDLFDNMEYIVGEAAEVGCGLDGDELPQLLSLRENKYVMEFEIIRDNKKLDPMKMLEDISNLYIYKITEEEKNDSVFTKCRSAGKNVKFTLFKGDSNIVSLADVYTESNTYSFVGDSRNKMPLVLGTDEKGNSIYTDFSKLYSLLVSGLPRSGKSWEVLTVIIQIAMYCSPREVNFYVGDTKNQTSDFYSLSLPHIKEFKGEQDKIIDMLRWLVNVEGERRKAVIGDYKNYNNYVDAHPDAADEMPRIYFIHDELMAFMSSLDDDKDLKREYTGLLERLVSQLPGMGMYFLGIPHRVRNDIIPKNVYSLIGGNINVMGKVDEYTSALGIKANEFNYKLTNQGDMAVKMPGVNKSNPTFARGVPIAPSDEGSARIADFIRSLWSKLDHDFYHGPRMDEIDKRREKFDEYSCGSPSHGGVKKNVIAPTSGGETQPMNQGIGRLRGGFTESKDYEEDISSVRLDGKEDFEDVTDTDFGEIFNN